MHFLSRLIKSNRQCGHLYFLEDTGVAIWARHDMHVDLYNKQMALHRSIIDIVKNIMFYTTTKMRQNECNSIFPWQIVINPSGVRLQNKAELYISIIILISFMFGLYVWTSMNRVTQWHIFLLTHKELFEFRLTISYNSFKSCSKQAHVIFVKFAFKFKWPYCHILLLACW